MQIKNILSEMHPELLWGEMADALVVPKFRAQKAGQREINKLGTTQAVGGAGATVSKNTNATAEEKHGFPDGVTWPPTAAWRPTAPQRAPPGVAGPSDSRPRGLDVRLAPDVRVRACVRAHRAGPAGHAPSPRGPTSPPSGRQKEPSRSGPPAAFIGQRRWNLYAVLRVSLQARLQTSLASVLFRVSLLNKPERAAGVALAGAELRRPQNHRRRGPPQSQEHPAPASEPPLRVLTLQIKHAMLLKAN